MCSLCAMDRPPAPSYLPSHVGPYGQPVALAASAYATVAQSPRPMQRQVVSEWAIPSWSAAQAPLGSAGPRPMKRVMPVSSDVLPPAKRLTNANRSHQPPEPVRRLLAPPGLRQKRPQPATRIIVDDLKQLVFTRMQSIIQAHPPTDAAMYPDSSGYELCKIKEDFQMEFGYEFDHKLLGASKLRDVIDSVFKDSIELRMGGKGSHLKMFPKRNIDYAAKPRSSQQQPAVPAIAAVIAVPSSDIDSPQLQLAMFLKRKLLPLRVRLRWLQDLEVHSHKTKLGRVKNKSEHDEVTAAAAATGPPLGSVAAPATTAATDTTAQRAVKMEIDAEEQAMLAGLEDEDSEQMMDNETANHQPAKQDGQVVRAGLGSKNVCTDVITCSLAGHQNQQHDVSLQVVGQLSEQTSQQQQQLLTYHPPAAADEEQGTPLLQLLEGNADEEVSCQQQQDQQQQQLQQQRQQQQDKELPSAGPAVEQISHNLTDTSMADVVIGPDHIVAAMTDAADSTVPAAGAQQQPHAAKLLGSTDNQLQQDADDGNANRDSMMVMGMLDGDYISFSNHDRLEQRQQDDVSHQQQQHQQDDVCHQQQQDDTDHSVVVQLTGLDSDNQQPAVRLHLQVVGAALDDVKPLAALDDVKPLAALDDVKSSAAEQAVPDITALHPMYSPGGAEQLALTICQPVTTSAEPMLATSNVSSVDVSSSSMVTLSAPALDPKDPIAAAAAQAVGQAARDVAVRLVDVVQEFSVAHGPAAKQLWQVC